MTDRALGAQAASNYGLVALQQALDAGLTPRMIQHRVESGRWEQVRIGVYRIAGVAPSYGQRLLSACLAIGSEAAASHRAAAQLHGLLTYRDPPIETTTTRARSPELVGVVVHRLMDLHPSWVEQVERVPCTSVARTLVDLGAVCRPGTVEAALDRAIGRRLVTPREVRRMMFAVARKGRRGIGTIRLLLADRLEDRPAGVLEARMSSLLASTALPPAVPEYVVRDEHGGFVAVVDFAYPDRRLAIEVDGYEAHMGLRAFQHDRVRDRTLRAAKWVPLHFTWHEVDKRNPRVAREIAAEYRSRSRELGF
jgi:hypothetical protein